ncbi:MAG: HMA2 domain-containing protein [Rhodopila sp.]
MSSVTDATPQSLPRIRIEHRIPGRLRLRIRAKRGDPAFFRRIEALLSAAPGVSRARANVQTGSILVEYSGDEAAVHAAARGGGLYVVEPPDVAGAAHPMSSRVDGKPAVSSPLDLAAMGLAGAGLIQLVRGEVVGSASENLWNAYGLYAVTRHTLPSALLIAFGLLQVGRGEVLGSATSLLLYAYSAWRMAQHRAGQDTI